MYQQVASTEDPSAAATTTSVSAGVVPSHTPVEEQVTITINSSPGTPMATTSAPAAAGGSPTTTPQLTHSPSTSGRQRSQRPPRGSLGNVTATTTAGGTGGMSPYLIHPPIAPIVRRYSSTDIATDEVISLAIDIYDTWDTEQRGYIASSEVTLKNMDQKFVDAIVRVLAFNSNIIYKENIIECISVLKNGDLSSKVKLLVQFMDSDGNQCISYDELKEYLKVSDDTMMAKLGLLKTRRNSMSMSTDESDHGVGTGGSRRGGGGVLTYEDLLSLFQESDRGLEAISIFCEQILRIFTQSVHKPTSGGIGNDGENNVTGFIRRNSLVGLTNGPLITTNPCDQCNEWSKKTSSNIQQWFTKQKHHLETLSHAEVFKLWLAALQIALWLTYFFYHKSHGYPLAFCFAKGFGLNLRILSILMYLTMARTTMGHLYSIRLLRPFIPLGINIEVHSFLGFSIMMHMFGHTFGHIAYQTMYTSGFQNAFTQNSLLRGSNWEDKLKGDGKTGFLLLFFVLIMGITACIRSLSPSYYQLFAYSHYLYLLYLPMIFLHIPTLWPYFIAITAIIVIERLYDLKQNTVYTTLTNSRPCNNGITYLSIPRYGMMTYPGSYYRIKIPALSWNEWHPFSLAGSTSSHHLSFFIASSGDWTRALHQLVKDPIRRSQTLVQVQGPFLAPASQALIRKPGAKILCVASGIGITPFFSVMATKVTDEVNFDNDRILYQQLFKETAQRSQKMKRGDPQQNSLFHVLLQTQQPQQQSTQPSQQQKRPSKSNVDGIVSGGLIQDVESGAIIDGNGNGSRPSSSTNVLKEDSNNNLTANNNSDASNSDEDDSLLKVVWSIRDVKELLFYLDYVHHLVKSQDQLLNDDDEDIDEETGRRHQSPSMKLMKRQGSRRNNEITNKQGRKRTVVEVEVYLTGLGNKSDPVYMLSQTLFLLSIANQSSSYMKIHFGRPDLEKIVKGFAPEEVYYCGGNALKEKLHDVCCQEKIPFYPEDFDSGGGAVIQAYQSVSKNVRSLCGCENNQDTKSGRNQPESLTRGSKKSSKEQVKK